MPGLFFTDAEGNRTYVEQENFAQAQQAGLSVVPGQTATYGENNTTVKGEDFVNRVLPFQDQGARLAGQEQIKALEDARIQQETYGTLGNQVLAGVAGVARGATAGLSDLALTGLGLAESEDLRGIRDANPTTSLVSEIGGAVVPGLLTGGTGSMAGVAKALPSGRATLLGVQAGAKAGGGIKGAIVAGGVEGGLFEAGQGVSNLVLSEQELSAEAAFAEIGLSAVYGTALGGAFGGVGETLSKVGNKMVGKATARAEQRVADEAIENTVPAFQKGTPEYRDFHFTLGQVNKDIDEAGSAILAQTDGLASKPGEIRTVYEAPKARQFYRAVENEFDKAASHAEMMMMTGAKPAIRRAKAAKHKINDFYKKHDAFKEGGGPIWGNKNIVSGGKLDELQDLYDDYALATKKLSDEVGLGPMAVTDDMRPVVTGEARYIEGAVEQAATTKAAQKRLQEALGGTKKVASAREMSEGIGAGKVKPPSLQAIFKQEPDEILRTVKTFEEYTTELKKMADLLEDGAGRTSGAVAQMEQELMDAVQSAIGSKGMAGEAAQEGMPDLASMALIFGLEEALLPDIGGPAGTLLEMALTYKLIKGGMKPAAMSKKASKLKALGQYTAGRMGGSLASKGSQGAEGAIQYGIGAGMAKGVWNFVTGGMGRMGQATGRAMGRIEMGMAKSLTGSGAVLKRAPATTGAILNSVRFGGDADAPPDNLPPLEAFKQRSTEINAAVANLPATQQSIHDKFAQMRQINIGVGDKMAGHATRTLQFLHEKMPKDPGNLQYFGTSRWRPNREQLDKWGRYVQAAKDPAGIVERFGEGRMSREEAETLRVLYPGHYAQVQKWVANNLPEIQEKMTYSRRIQISSLMGVPADPTMKDVKVWQRSFEEMPQQSPQQQMNLDTNNTKTMAQTMAGVNE